MERIDAMKYQYKIVQAPAAPSLETRINELADQGYRVIQFSPATYHHATGGEPRTFFCAMMEREAQEDEEAEQPQEAQAP